jgi:hypothetical protein
MTFRLLGFPRQVQEVHAHKDDQKSADQGHGLASIGRIEPLEEDRAGNDGRRREKDVVNRVDAVQKRASVSTKTWLDLARSKSTHTLVENVSSALLK